MFTNLVFNTIVAMKKLIFLSLIFSTMYIVKAHGKTESGGLIFFKGNWKEAKVEAKRQRKLIFIDFYTDWCAPCKRMDAEIFPDKMVGELYNKLFINLKVNAEKGEGVMLARDFGVRAYPTWLFTDETGHAIFRGIDFMLAKEFIDLGKRAAAHRDDSGSLAELEQRFLKGERQQDFLKDYISKRTEMKLPTADLLNIYLTIVPEKKLKSVEEVLFLGKNIGTQRSAAVEHVLSGLSSLSELQRKEVSPVLFSLLSNEYGLAQQEKRLEDQGNIIRQMEQLLPSVTAGQRNTASLIKLLYFTNIKDGESLKQVGQSIAPKLMAVRDEIIAQKNMELYQEIMEPFLSGKRDSTKIPNFSKEAKQMRTQHSAEIASRLYQVSNAYFLTLSSDDPALQDALRWAERAHALTPNEATQKLRENLKLKVGG